MTLAWEVSLHKLRSLIIFPTYVIEVVLITIVGRMEQLLPFLTVFFWFSLVSR